MVDLPPGGTRSSGRLDGQPTLPAHPLFDLLAGGQGGEGLVLGYAVTEKPVELDVHDEPDDLGGGPLIYR